MFKRELLNLGELFKSLPSFWWKAFVETVSGKLEFLELSQLQIIYSPTVRTNEFYHVQFMSSIEIKGGVSI